MTGTPSHRSHGDQGQFEEDTVRYGLVVGVGIASLILFALGIFWADYILKAGTRARYGDAPVATPKYIGDAEIGIVDQKIFEDVTTGAEMRRAQERELKTYGWIDRERGTIRIPIDRAMDMMAEGQR